MTSRDEYEPDFGDEDIEFEAEAELEGRFDALRERGREMFGGVAERGKERLVQAADRGKTRVAERLSGSADYLRNSDVDTIQSDLVSEIRRHPIRSAAIALGTGYVLGKVLSPPVPSFGRRKKKSGLGDQISRAIFSSMAAVITAKLQASLVADQVVEEVEAEKPRARKPRTRAPRAPRAR